MNLEQNYNRDDFLSFLKSFIPNFSKDIRRVATNGLQVIKEASYLGESPEFNLSVFEITHSSSADARVALAMDGFRVMKNSATYRALVIYRAEKGEDWRLSLMTATPDVNKKGEIGQVFSNPRRFSFFLGLNAKVNTPYQFLVKQGTVKDFAELQKRFSIEVVSKEFYQEIAELFTKLVGGIRGTGSKKKKYKEIIELPFVDSKSQISHEFGVRLIGRVIFCWFLREKKSDSGLPLVPKKLLSLDSAKETKDFYHAKLEPLFFEVLNRPIESRKEQYSKDFYAQIPYLNGGLFLPQEHDFYSFDEGNQSINHNIVKIPDEWLVELFKVLERYNFTVDENTSVDVDLSIDPEMLGRIFENLLAEINPETGESARKSTGSYYTPRAIVEYMVEESLYQYLKEKTGISEDKLRALLSYDLSDDESHPLNEGEKEQVVEALSNITILDPACGSGAFPIGAMQKIVFILQRVDPDASLWLQRQITNTAPEVRCLIEREFKNKNFDYIRKLGVIRRSIFGVDIQPIAIEISRLRCFLTLVVEESVKDDNPNRDIEPLPNLDFKFVTANSLIDLPQEGTSAKQQGLFGADEESKIKELKTIMEGYFNSHNSEREKYKKRFYEVRDKLFEHTVNNNSWNKKTQHLSTWDPFGHKASSWFNPEWMFGTKDGFDIVVANPPYIASYGRQAKKFSKEDIKYYIKNYDTFSSISDRKNVSINTVMLFFERGINFLKDSGVLSYVIDQAFLNVDVYIYSRQFLLNNSMLQEIVTDLKFPQVVAEACILQVLKSKTRNQYEFSWKKGDVNSPIRKLNTSEIDKKDYQFILSSNMNIIKKIEQKSKPLNTYTETTTGMQIIPEYFLSDDDSVLRLPKWHRAVFSNNIYKYKIAWPVKNQKGKYITYDTDLQKRIRRLLKKRIDKGEKCRAPETLSIGSTEKENRFFVPKIIMSQTVSNANGIINLQACLDDEIGYYGNVSIHLIKHKDVNFLKFLLGIINSKLICFYAIEKKLILGAEHGSKKTPQIRKGAMDKLPIIVDHVNQKSFIVIVNKILAIAKDEDYLQNNVKLNKVRDYEKQIDWLVYKLYGLPPSEIKIVENAELR